MNANTDRRKRKIDKAVGSDGHHRRRQRFISNNGNHRFGRVMSQPPKLKLYPRSSCYPTVSIAVPGSFVSNAQTRELQTQLAGQIARAAAVYRVDEIVVFDDGLGSKLKTFSNYRRGPVHQRREGAGDDEHKSKSGKDGNQSHNNKQKEKSAHLQPSTDPHVFLARILQYCECPQYLRRNFFPMHPDLQFSGLLPPLDMPHHLRRGDVSRFREGVVTERDGGETGSLVNCGVPNQLVQIDRVITSGMRCTVQLDPKAYESKQKPSSKNGLMKGKVVSPTTPRDQDGIYWGYSTRMASSIVGIFEECPYEGGYDLKVGTSERGDISIDDPHFCLKKKQPVKRTEAGDHAQINHFEHLLIVFGGVAGIEESVDADESMILSGEDSKKMFDMWVNICPYQGSRTIRSEEAVLIALARLSPFIAENGMALKSSSRKKISKNITKTEDVDFSDETVSDESSDDE